MANLYDKDNRVGWWWTRPDIGKPVCDGLKCRTLLALNGGWVEFETMHDTGYQCWYCKKWKGTI